VLVMQMEEGLDTGPILMAERVMIGRKTAGDLAGELSRLGADLLIRSLGALERGAVQAQPQPECGVTYARKIFKDEARIDWTRSATELDCLIRGLSPSPGAFTEIRGERLKVLNAMPVKDRGEPGEVITDDLTVGCGEGALKLLTVQRAGKAIMQGRELLKGFDLPAGTRFS
jgi:methionyl-tRNA formyltransferase